jgi:hypothetical protein
MLLGGQMNFEVWSQDLQDLNEWGGLDSPKKVTETRTLSEGTAVLAALSQKTGYGWVHWQYNHKTMVVWESGTLRWI